MISHFKTLLQIVGLALVLLTWAGLDLFMGRVYYNWMPLHLQLSDCPTEIYTGEIYNMTISYSINSIKRREHYNVSGLLGIRCNGRDGNVSLVFDNWILQQSFGQVNVEYNVSKRDLPTVSESLCLFELGYQFKSSLQPTLYQDKVISSVFRLSTEIRPIPLPEPQDPNLTEDQWLLATQLRTSTSQDGIINPHDKLILNPIPNEANYNFFWFSVEDDPLFCQLEPELSVWYLLLPLIVYVFLNYGASGRWVHHKVDLIKKWAYQDIQNAIEPVPVKTRRRRQAA